MDQPDIFLSLVIPAYNEETIIADNLQKVGGFFSANFPNAEIIVSDDGSSDRTVVLAAKLAGLRPPLKIIRNEHRGKGWAVRQGMLAAQGKYIFFSDADLSTPLAELPAMVKKLEDGFDLVIASRALLRSRIVQAQPVYRSGAGKIFNLLVRRLFGLNIKDTQCGFKGFTQKAARAIFSRQKLDGFAFDVEVLVLAKKLGYKIAEVPVSWTNRPPTRLRLWRDSLKMFGEVIRLKWERADK